MFTVEKQFNNLFNFLQSNDICELTEEEKKQETKIVWYETFKKEFLKKLISNFEKIFGCEIPEFSDCLTEKTSYTEFKFDFLRLERMYGLFYFFTDHMTIAVDRDKKHFYGIYFEDEKLVYREFGKNIDIAKTFDNYIERDLSKINQRFGKEKLLLINYNIPPDKLLFKFIKINTTDIYNSHINMDGNKIDDFIIKVIKIIDNNLITNFNLKKTQTEKVKEEFEKIEKEFGKSIHDLTEEEQFLYLLTVN